MIRHFALTIIQAPQLLNQSMRSGSKKKNQNKILNLPINLFITHSNKKKYLKTTKKLPVTLKKPPAVIKKPQPTTKNSNQLKTTNPQSNPTKTNGSKKSMINLCPKASTIKALTNQSAKKVKPNHTNSTKNKNKITSKTVSTPKNKTIAAFQT